jgi:hypothetical protein
MRKLSALATAVCFASLPAAAQTASLDTKVGDLVRGSACARTDWRDRGRATLGYIKGMALVFAKSVCQASRPDVAIVSAGIANAPVGAEKTDGLVHYKSIFASHHMAVDTLRHAYVLMIGLGMRESSGMHCVGRDRSANFTTADSAEAGLFQTSYGVRTVSETLTTMYQAYKQDHSACLLDVFSKSVQCQPHDAKNWGSGEGNAWQALTKSCPAFATEYAAVVLRLSGGKRGEFGPIRNRAAQVIDSCDTLLGAVQQLVTSKPELCPAH